MEVVRGSPGAVGFGELTYVIVNDIPFGSVQNREGAFVQADLDSVTAAGAAAAEGLPDDLRGSVTDAAGKDAYPISAMTLAVVYVRQPADKARRLAEFLRWVTHEGQRYAAELHYAPLPSRLVDRLEKSLDRIGTGD